MNVKIEKVKFESVNDIIDYVSLGMVPTKKNFDDLMSGLTNPQAITIPDTITDDAQREQVYQNELNARVQLQTTLAQVYKNRQKNKRNLIIFGGLAAIGTVAITSGIAYTIGKKRAIDEIIQDSTIASLATTPTCPVTNETSCEYIDIK